MSSRPPTFNHQIESLQSSITEAMDTHGPAMDPAFREALFFDLASSMPTGTIAQLVAKRIEDTAYSKCFLGIAADLDDAREETLAAMLDRIEDAVDRNVGTPTTIREAAQA